MRKLIFFVFLALPSIASAQCFSSAGNPVGGSNNMGNLDKRTLSLVAFYHNSYSDRFFEGDKPSSISLIDKARYNFMGALMAYGFSDRFTVEAEVGYFIDKTKFYAIPEGYSLKGFGLTNALVSGKYQIYYNPVKKIEFAAAAGLKFPFSLKSMEVNHVRLPFDMQPSTSTIGGVIQAYLIKQHSLTGMRYFLFSRFEANGTNRDGYRFGNSLVNSVFVSKHLIRTSMWPISGTVILQVRNEIRGQTFIREIPEPASGSFKLFLSPQINLAIREKFNVSFMVDLPVYQYYRNAQIADKISFSIVLNKALEL